MALAIALAAFLPTAGNASHGITIDVEAELQVVEGFGGFGPKKVWWDEGPWHDQAYLDLIVDDLGSSIVRTQLYWDGEPQNDNDDPNVFDWSKFNFGRASDNGKQFAFLRDLGAKKGVRLIASVWSPPIWMKRDPDDKLAVFCRGQCGGHLDRSMDEEFAEYLVAYVLQLRKETGVELWALSLQNELIFANPFESCVYTADRYAKLLRTVAARFAREGLSTRFYGPEHMGSFQWNTDARLFSAILDDADVAQHLDAYAVHGYVDGVRADEYDPAGWIAIRDRVKAAGKQLWMTETSNDREEASWPGAWRMAKHLHAALKYGHVNAWVYWYYADHLVRGNQPLPLYHLFKGWYRYVRPGFVQVESTSSDAGILVTAFKREGSLTVVLLNDSGRDKTTTIALTRGHLPGSFAVFRASEAEGFVQRGVLRGDTITLPKSTITTLVHEERAEPPGAGRARVE